MTRGAPALLTPAELKALRPASPATGGTVTLWGRQVPWRPLSVAIYDRFIISRFEAARSFFVLGAQVDMARSAIADAEAEGRPVDPEMVQIVDGKAYMTAQASDGAAATIAFIAAGIGAPGNDEIERQLLDASDDELDAALETIEQGTWGGDPARFFAAVGKRLAGRTLQVVQTAAGTEPSTKTRTTRTASKATTSSRTTSPNRRSKRAQAAKARSR